MPAAYVSAALLLLSRVDPADRWCPPGSVERVERVAEGTLTVCIADKDIRIGPYTLVDPDGVTLALGQYERGLQAGRRQTWHNNSARHEDGSFTKGKRSGWWTRWHPNGQKAEEGEYRADYEQGVWRPDRVENMAPGRTTTPADGS